MIDEVLIEAVAKRRKDGDSYEQIRADLEAVRQKPFKESEWASIRFGAGISVAFDRADEDEKRRADLKAKGLLKDDEEDERDVIVSLRPHNGQWKAEIISGVNDETGKRS